MIQGFAEKRTSLVFLWGGPAERWMPVWCAGSFNDWHLPSICSIDISPLAIG
jgi:hypothetical protein